MYIAGLNLSISSTQMVEALVVFSVVDFLRYMRNSMKTLPVKAESTGGRIRVETVPRIGKIISGVHMLASYVPIVTYVGALVLNKFQQPAWMARFAFPDEIDGVRLDPVWKGVLRVGACVAGLAVKPLVDAAFYHLGDQWHVLGRRERPRVVQTGPYAWVRHPLYSVVLLQQALWAIMFWSYMQLAALGIVAAAFAVKMPIEEAMIQRDAGIRDEYREYKKKVPARIIPYIW